MALQGDAVAPLLVLVVDDDPDTTESTALLLERYGCDVCVALTGAEAIQHASAFRPDLVLLDLALPDMDGYRVARAIRRAPWGGAVTIIAVSGLGQEADKQRCREAGIDSHLSKPVEPAEFERLVIHLQGSDRKSA
jgi:CheY-like chemotaxis protein